MPCRDYDSDYDRSVAVSTEMTKLRVQNDRLARIACDAMTQLVAVCAKNKQHVVVNPETIDWWKQHQIADKAEQERVAKAEERMAKATERVAKAEEHNKKVAIRAQKRRDMIAAMSKEQREILGL